MIRQGPVEAAIHFIERHFPDCDAALLAGSVIRNEATDTSDLDIVVFDSTYKSSFRTSCLMNGWPIEAFVHTWESYNAYFKSDCERGRPSLPRMVAEGEVLKDNGRVYAIKKEAEEILAAGPKAWTETQINTKRYILSDLVEDLKGSEERIEGIFIAGELTQHLCEFVLRVDRRWTGLSKWGIRALRQYDEHVAERFGEAFDSYYKTNSKQAVVDLVEQVLEPHGGMLFHGYSLGRREKKE